MHRGRADIVERQVEREGAAARRARAAQLDLAAEQARKLRG